MLFPSQKLKYTRSYQGKTEPEGWLVLDIAGVDLDGVTKIYIPYGDVQSVHDRGDVASNRLQQARALLGVDPE